MVDTNNTFRHHCGFDIIDGKYAQMQVYEHHLNGGTIVHGGLLATLLDHASSLPITLKDGQVNVTISLNINYISVGRKGDILTAYPTLIKQGRNVAFIDAVIKNQNDVVVATSNAVFNIITLHKR